MHIGFVLQTDISFMCIQNRYFKAYIYYFVVVFADGDTLAVAAGDLVVVVVAVAVASGDVVAKGDTVTLVVAIGDATGFVFFVGVHPVSTTKVKQNTDNSKQIFLFIKTPPKKIELNFTYTSIPLLFLIIHILVFFIIFLCYSSALFFLVILLYYFLPYCSLYFICYFSHKFTISIWQQLFL
jgi:hypothetical protein